MRFPLSFEEIFEHIGFPAYFKPHAGGGWKSVYKVNDHEEFFKAYEESDGLVMTLQENIDFDEYYRCYCIGKTDVHIMPYEPRNPHHERYHADFTPSDKLSEKMTKDSIAICEILGYDFNTIEFAVSKGIPYAIDFTNPAPDAELTSIGVENFEWMVGTSAKFLIAEAKESAKKKKGAKKDLNWREMIMA